MTLTGIMTLTFDVPDGSCLAVEAAAGPVGDVMRDVAEVLRHRVLASGVPVADVSAVIVSGSDPARALAQIVEAARV